MPGRRWWIVALLAVALLLILGRAVAAVYVDYRWFEAMGALSVWRAKLLYTALLKGLSGAAATAFIFANLIAVRRSVVSLVLPRRVANLEIGEEVPGHFLVGAAAVLALAFGAFLTAPRDWTTLALARKGIPFGETDPFFEADIGFFMYLLPLEDALYIWAIITVLLVSALVTFLYALTPSLRWKRGQLYVSNYVRRHVVVLGAILLALLAWSFRLDAYQTVLDGSGAAGTVTYADDRANIPVRLWLSVLTLGAAVVVLWFGWQGQLRVAFGAVTAVVVLSLFVRQLAPWIVRRTARTQNPVERERPYLDMRADYTRRAFDVDRIGIAPPDLTFSSPSEAAMAVSVWDARALTRSVTRLRRTDAIAEHVGWSVSPIGLLALLPERPVRVPDSGNTGSAWTVARVLAATADARGDPLRVTSTGARSIGEDDELEDVIIHDSTAGYLIISDSLSVTATPSLGSWLSRLAHAWSLQNYRLVFDDLPQASPHIVTRGGVRERVSALVPFFSQGSSIAPVVAEDTLWWSVDLYATSAYYPLSQRMTTAGARQSYFQHAATALVNARTGTVTIVADSTRDPVSESWVRAFPDLFDSWSRLPNKVVASLPPAMDAVRAHGLLLARYGRRGELPRAGSLANESADSLLVGGMGSLMALRMPGGERRVATTTPVLDSNDRVAGIVIGLGGPDRRTHWRPRPDTGTGARWSAVVDDLRRAADSVAAGDGDPRAVRGRIRAVPLRTGLAFIQPTYTWPPDGAPSLSRVSVLFSDRVSVGETLADAVDVSAVPGYPPTPESTPLDVATFRARLRIVYEQMRLAQQRGDWIGFGKAYEALGALLTPTQPEP